MQPGPRNGREGAVRSGPGIDSGAGEEIYLKRKMGGGIICTRMHTSGGPLVVKEVARLLSVLADPTRVRLVRLLLHQELCVCELVDALRIPQYKVSRHLSRLRGVGLVEARRNGRWMYYSVGRRVGLDGLQHDLLKLIDVHINRTPDADRDDSRLARRLALRQAGRCVKGGTCC